MVRRSGVERDQADADAGMVPYRSLQGILRFFFIRSQRTRVIAQNWNADTVYVLGETNRRYADFCFSLKDTRKQGYLDCTRTRVLGRPLFYLRPRRPKISILGILGLSFLLVESPMIYHHSHLWELMSWDRDARMISCVYVSFHF